MGVHQDDLTAAERISLAIERVTEGREWARRRGIMPIARLHADLMSDRFVSFTPFSDSTGDGNTIPAHTSNNPGNVDWDADPKGAQAWPARLETYLLRLYPHRSTANLQVHNASASGKTVDWFLTNWKARSIENDYYDVSRYSVPSLGLNDVEEFMVGKKADLFECNYIKWLREQMDMGIMPILTPADPCGNQGGIYGTYSGGNPRDNRVVEFLINRLAEVVADLVGCMWLDHATPMKAVMNNGYGAPSVTGAMGNVPRAGDLWDTSVGTPLLHGQALWHGLKAQTLAMLMCPKVQRIPGGKRQKITARFAETAFKPDAAAAPTLYTRRNGQGMEERILGADAQTNITMIEAWVWCESSDLSAIYRATDGDSLSSSSAVSSHPKVGRESLWDANVSEVQAGTFGWSEQGSINGSATYLNAHRTDQPAVIQRLQPGLNRLYYLTGTYNSERYIGYFDVYPALLKPWSNALKDSGPIRKTFQAADSARKAAWAPESPDLSNVLSMVRGQEIHLLIDGELPDGCGWILSHNQRQLADAAYGDRTGWVLYRNSNQLQMRFVHSESAGIGLSSALTNGDTGTAVTTGTLTDAGNAQKLRVRAKIDASTNVFNLWVYEGWGAYESATQVLALTLTAQSGGPILPPLLAGVAGGLFANSGLGSRRVCALDRFTIDRTPDA